MMRLAEVDTDGVTKALKKSAKLRKQIEKKLDDG